MTVYRNFFGMMLLAAVLLVGLSALQPVHAARMEQQSVTKVLNLMEGDWYDANGNRVLEIGGGYINGCRVLAAYDFAGASLHGMGRFEILENTGTRNLYLEWDIRHSNKDSIKLNDHQMLHRTAKPSFNESIAGIHLGMTSAEVTAIHGTPPQTGNLRPYVNTYGWYYPNLRIAVTFDADIVDRIFLLKGSRAVLERSWLNCENTPYEFVQAYQMKRIPEVRYDDSNVFTGCHAIGGEEYLSFGNRMEYVMLSKYWN